jgi:RNA recognition motif-containing protein
VDCAGRLVTRRSNDSTVICSGYAVWVQNLPIDATEGEIRRHFSDLFQVGTVLHRCTCC